MIEIAAERAAEPITGGNSMDYWTTYVVWVSVIALAVIVARARR